MSDLSITPANVKLVGSPTGYRHYVTTTVTAGQILTDNLGVYGELIEGASPSRVARLGWNGGQYRKLEYYMCMALTNGSSGQFVMKAVPGHVVDLGVSTSNNTMYFASPNDGNICLYSDLQAGNRIVVVGIGLGGTRFLFKPLDTQLIR